MVLQERKSGRFSESFGLGWESLETFFFRHSLLQDQDRARANSPKVHSRTGTARLIDPVSRAREVRIVPGEKETPIGQPQGLPPGTRCRSPVRNSADYMLLPIRSGTGQQSGVVISFSISARGLFSH